MKVVSIIASIFILTTVSCSSYKFAKDGVFVEDVDQYFNNKEKLNVWLYMNFYPNKADNKGLRVNKLYEQDKSVFKTIGLRSAHSKVLFSAVPDNGVPYHLIAVYHQNMGQLPIDYHKKNYNKAYYLQKDFKQGRLDIRHVLIPDDKGRALSLVYYISAEKHLSCPFCKLDYLANINAEEFQVNMNYYSFWPIRVGEEDRAKGNYVIKGAERLKWKYLRVSEDYGNSDGIKYFRIRENNQDSISLKLSPGRYFIDYQNKRYSLIRRDTVDIH